MERIDSINAARIAWCCADHGIAPEQLAIECGIAEATMQRVMEGKGGLTFKQLSTIAEFFGRGVLFFLEEGAVVAEQVHTPQFRTLANQKPELSPKLRALIERAERHRDFYLALREESDAADHPRFNPPDLGRDLVEAAAVARTWLGLPAVNDFESYRRAVEARGVLVFRSQGYNGKWQIAKASSILGFSLYDTNCPVIVVKKLEWESRQAFTLMHELGHILLHKVSSIDDEHDLYSHEGSEQEANRFAGHLLVPDAFLRQISDAARPEDVSGFDTWLEPQRRAWGVSGEVILRRLTDSQRLSRELYEAYRRWRAQTAPPQEAESGSRAYRHREPVHIFGETYVRTVLSAVDARSITLAKASSYLDRLKIKDLRQLEKFYAGV